MPSGADDQLNPRVDGGQVEEITPGDPVAGQELSYTLPDGYTYEVRSLAYRFTADANVANRNVGAIVTDGSNVELARSFSNGNLTAGTTTEVNHNAGQVGAGQTTVSLGVSLCTFMKGRRLLPGWKIKTKTNNLQAGDAYTNVRLVVIRRPYPN